MIRFACPGCQAPFSVADDKAGKTTKCPKCGTLMTVPGAPAGSAPAPAAPTPPAPTPPKVTPTVVKPSAPVEEEDDGGDDFAFGKPSKKPARDEEEDEDEAPKPKKKPARDEEDQEDAKPVKSKRGKKDEDEEEEDEKPAKSGGGALWIVLGVFNILAMLSFCGLGGSVSFCSGTVLAAAKTDTPPRTVDANGRPLSPAEQIKDKEETEKVKKAMSEFFSYLTIFGIVGVIISVLLLPAAIGCFMKKGFGKILSILCGAISLLLGIVITMVVWTQIPEPATKEGKDVVSNIQLYTSVAALGTFGVFGFFTMLLGFLCKSAKAVKKSDEDEDEDEDEDDAPKKKGKKKFDDEDEDEAPKPKKKVVPLDVDEEEAPKPKKKAAVKDDDEEESPKPKKKRPRNDDDD